MAVAAGTGAVQFVAPALTSAGAGPLTTREAIGQARPPPTTAVQADSEHVNVRMGTKLHGVVGPADLAGTPTPPAVVAIIHSVPARHHPRLKQVLMQARLMMMHQNMLWTVGCGSHHIGFGSDLDPMVLMAILLKIGYRVTKK